jgi:molybdopterin converting factor small subunit
MIVRVKLFAAAAQYAGQPEVEVELPEDATVGMLQQELMKQYPQLQPLAGHLLLAIDQDLAGPQTRVRPDMEVACLPPPSGG